MSRGMWRGVVPRAGCCSSAPRTISCPWPTTRRRSTGRWRYCKRCSEQPTDLGSFAETRHRTAPRPDLPSTSSLPLRLPSEGPACGFAQGLAPTHCPTEASNRDPPAQAALGLLPHGDPGPAGRRTGDSHQWAGARHAPAAVLARQELVERLQPALAEVNREIYRRAREFSVQAAFVQVAGIVDAERRVLWGIVALALAAGLLASWLISRSLARPLNELRHAMAVVGAGDLDHAIEPRSSDEIGDLARAFAQMTERLRQSRAQLVQSEKLASIGQMAAGVAHGLRNPLASLRAAAQLAQRRVEGPAGAAREQLNAIIEQVDRLDQRIGDLLTFSRPAPFRPLRESVEV